MMNTYRKTFTSYLTLTFIDGTTTDVIFDEDYIKTIEEENNTETIIKDFDLSNTIEYNKYKEYNRLNTFQKVYHKRKGYYTVYINYFMDKGSVYKKVKNIQGKVKITYSLTSMSIQDILKYPNSTKAIQYLIERGITTISKLND